jgi:hypothetical protein
MIMLERVNVGIWSWKFWKVPENRNSFEKKWKFSKLARKDYFQSIGKRGFTEKTGTAGCSFTICLLDNKRSACLIRFFSYAEYEIPGFMTVTLAIAQFNKLLLQLVNDARLTLCILSVTAVKNFFKITTSFVVLIFSDVWRLMRSPSTVYVPNLFKITCLFISWLHVKPCPPI